jgi:hypothetical protein
MADSNFNNLRGVSLASSTLVAIHANRCVVRVPSYASVMRIRLLLIRMR